jgi:hypothetical protein
MERKEQRAKMTRRGEEHLPLHEHLLPSGTDLLLLNP